MDFQPKISVIIVNYNGREFLGACLESVLKSDYSNFEIILVDNDSSDGSAEMVKKKFPKIKLIINKKNLGFARANNIGIEQAGGDAYFLLNNDTIVCSELIKILSQELFDTEQNGIVGPKIYYMEEKNRIWFAGGKIDWKRMLSWHEGEGLRDEQLINDQKKEADFITGCALMIKKEVANRIGLLDERFFCYYEDADWCQRAKRAGFRVLYVPFGGVWHIKSATATRTVFNKQQAKFKIIAEYLKNLNRLKYNKYRNRLIFYWRYQPRRYKFGLLVDFIFIQTPIFLWSIVIKSPTSLLKTLIKYSKK